MPRRALIIGTTQHRWRPFSRLPSPALDLQGLHDVLTAPAIGGFETPAPLCNQPAFGVAMELEAFFCNRERDDLLLLYIAGHVLLDERGTPFLLTQAADRGRWRSSVIDFAFLRDVMDQSSSERQVVLLDCGLGSMGIGAPELGSRIDLDAALGGRGRAVLSASSTIRYHLDDAGLEGDASAAAMLRRIVEGLGSGYADLDGDGRVSLDDLAGYVRGRGAEPGVPIETCGERLEAHGALVIARRAQALDEAVARHAAAKQASAPRRRNWASHAANSVASWLAEHVGR